MYKIETHLHTAYASHCGYLGAEALMKMYKACGYDGICVTDHYNRDTIDYLDIDLNAKDGKIDTILHGYEMLKRESEKGGYNIKVYPGVEIRFDESENDYLLFGFHRELLEDPDYIMKMGIEAFSRLAREDNALLIQAHPYRRGCAPANPDFLEGVEIFNGNSRHENNNDRAKKFAENGDLIMTGGSDCHRPGDEGSGGILSEILPKDGFELAQVLRSKTTKIFARSFR